MCIFFICKRRFAYIISVVLCLHVKCSISLQPLKIKLTFGIQLNFAFLIPSRVILCKWYLTNPDPGLTQAIYGRKSKIFYFNMIFTRTQVKWGIYQPKGNRQLVCRVINDRPNQDFLSPLSSNKAVVVWPLPRPPFSPRGLLSLSIYIYTYNII